MDHCALCHRAKETVGGAFIRCQGTSDGSPCGLAFHFGCILKHTLQVLREIGESPAAIHPSNWIGCPGCKKCWTDLSEFIDHK